MIVTRIMLVVVAVLLALASWRLWLSDEGLREVWRLGQAVEVQEEQNLGLKQRNSELEAEVKDLKEGLDAVEEKARQELGMTREGETFFQVVEPEEPVED